MAGHLLPKWQRHARHSPSPRGLAPDVADSLTRRQDAATNGRPSSALSHREAANPSLAIPQTSRSACVSRRVIPAARWRPCFVTPAHGPMQACAMCDAKRAGAWRLRLGRPAAADLLPLPLGDLDWPLEIEGS